MHANLVDWIHRITIHDDITIFGIWLLMLYRKALIKTKIIHLVFKNTRRRIEGRAASPRFIGHWPEA